MAPRRGARRAPTSDIEDGPSQRSAPEDVEDEEEGRRGTQVKAEKVQRARRGAAPPADDQDEDGDQNMEGEDAPEDDGVIDVDNFGNHPMREEQLVRLRGMRDDWTNIAQIISKQADSSMPEVAATLAGTGSGEAEQKSLVLLDEQLKNLMDCKAMLKVQEKALQGIIDKPDTRDVVKAYNQDGKALWEAWGKQTARQKYSKDETYRKYKEGVYNAQHPGSAMPPITTFMPKEDGDDSDDEEEFEIGGVTENFKCPILLVLMKEPVTSRKCNHTFSKEAIDGTYQPTSPSVQPCPSAGCTVKLTRADFVDDKVMAKRIRDYERNLARSQANEEEADEIIE